MDKHRSLKLVTGIVARIVNVSSNKDTDMVIVEPTPHYLNFARKLLFIIGSKQTDVDVRA